MLKALRAGRIRTRLTIWYVFLLAAILISYAVGSSAVLWWDLRHELDRHGIQDIETVEGLLRFNSSGQLTFDENYHNHAASKQVLERLLEVLSPHGNVLLRNERLGNQALGAAPIPGEGVGGYSARWARLDDGTVVRLFSRSHKIGGVPILIRLAYNQDAIRQPALRFLLSLLATLPFTLVLAGAAGYVLAKRALQPVQAITQSAEGIDGTNLEARVPVGAADDEIAHLARVFNKMLERIERAFEQLHRFTSDASHELRTPLTAIRSVGEVALDRNGTAHEYKDVIGSMLEEVSRLTQLTESLLTISRADAGQFPLHISEFPAMDLVEEVCGLLGVLAEEKNQELRASGNGELWVRADRVLVRQALMNIIHNAVRHAPEGGRIAVLVEAAASDKVTLEIADNGPGIPAEHATRVFDRFYRADDSRSSQSGGAGLGLAIAKWALEAQGGDLSLAGNSGPGCTFRLTLPRAAAMTAETAPG